MRSDGPILNDSLSDDDLVGYLRAGQIAAFDVLYTRHYPLVWKFAYRFTGTRDAAQDLAQEIFASLWERRATLVLTGSLRAYLLAAVRFRAVDALRHEEVVHQVTEEVDDETHPVGMGTPFPSPEEETDDALLRLRIHEELGKLPERQRTALLLRWEQGLSNQEIAEVLNIGKAAVSRLLGRAVELLRSAL